MALELVAINAIRLARLELGETVAVVGLGVISQLCCQLARLAGARRVIGFGYHAGHLEAARAGGVTAAADPRQTSSPLEVVRERNRGELADVVLEASGSATAIDLALHLARRTGRVVLAGSPAGPVPLELHETVHGQGLHLIGAHTSTLPFGELTLQPGWSVERAATLFWDLLTDGGLKVASLWSLPSARRHHHRSARRGPHTWPPAHRRSQRHPPARGDAGQSLDGGAGRRAFLGPPGRWTRPPWRT